MIRWLFRPLDRVAEHSHDTEGTAFAWHLAQALLAAGGAYYHFWAARHHHRRSKGGTK